jgi:hypothetical protein
MIAGGAAGLPAANARCACSTWALPHTPTLVAHTSNRVSPTGVEARATCVRFARTDRFALSNSMVSILRRDVWNSVHSRKMFVSRHGVAGGRERDAWEVALDSGGVRGVMNSPFASHATQDWTGNDSNFLIEVVFDRGSV